MNSGNCTISITSWVYDLSFYCGCTLVLTRMSFSFKVLLEKSFYIVYWFVLWFA